MTGKRLAVIPLVLLSFFAAPSQAATDEVRIIRGFLSQLSDLNGDLSVEGTSGVRIDAALREHFASIRWDRICPYFPCLPGEVVSIGASYGPSPVTGTGQVTMRGQTYGLWSGPDGADAQLEFDGAIVLPEFTSSGTAEVSAPFAFSGSLQVPNLKEPGTYDVFELRGSGVATVSLSRSRFTGGWIVGRVIYEFAPRGAVIPQ
jgi:hypothetical protein